MEWNMDSSGHMLEWSWKARDKAHMLDWNRDKAHMLDWNRDKHTCWIGIGISTHVGLE